MASSPPTLLDFTGKTVVLTGAASGMGAETLSLLTAAGAQVEALDIAEIGIAEIGIAEIGGAKGASASVRYHYCDLGDAASIDAVVRDLPDRIDNLMNCAGVPNGGRFAPDEVMRINWLGLRHLTEALLPRIPEGGSVVHIASTAGRSWPDRVEAHRELMAAASFDQGLAWIDAHAELIGDGYAFSKEAVQYYTLWRSVQLLADGVRMNSICPGITDTGIIGDFRKGMGDEIIDHAERVAGRMAQPAEMAPAMLFLADPAAASYINGVNLNIDRGTGAARLTEQSDPALIWNR